MIKEKKIIKTNNNRCRVNRIAAHQMLYCIISFVSLCDALSNSTHECDLILNLFDWKPVLYFCKLESIKFTTFQIDFTETPFHSGFVLCFFHRHHHSLESQAMKLKLVISKKLFWGKQLKYVSFNCYFWPFWTIHRM